MISRSEYIKVRKSKQWHVPQREDSGTACGMSLEWGDLIAARKAESIPQPACRSCAKFDANGFPLVVRRYVREDTVVI